MSESVAARVPNSADLENYAMKQWESVLLQLVDCAADGPAGPKNPFIIKVFQRSGLLTPSSRENESPSLTDLGFQFLLMDTNSQLWQLVREYVTSSEDRGTDSGELVGFLLELGFHLVGEAYSVNSLSPALQKVLDELAALGLVKLQQGMKESWYIPTKLASNLSASLSESTDWQSSEGFVVVETNFKVYAYTSSKLQTEILRCFTRLEYQLPNLVVATLTKESVNKALGSGISAEQIISFLRKHAHPHVAQKIPVVPETVSDQLRLWETDRNRVQFEPAYFYDDFPTMAIYEAVVAHARDLGGLLFEDASAKRLIVRSDLHEDMRQYIRKQSSGAPAQRK